jgi:hypothetical protein
VWELVGSCCGNVWLLFGAVISWRTRSCSWELRVVQNSSKKHVFWLLGEFVLNL